MYKSMQFLYVAKKLHFGNASLLAFKDDFSKFHYTDADVDKKTPIYEGGVWSRFTVGGYLVGTTFRKLGFTASAFYQGGKYREGTSLDEYLLSLSTMYSAGRKFSFGPGIDITSGNNGSDPTKKYQRFDPLYGTPHKFWGYMDYFYVASPSGVSGLEDYYAKLRYKYSDKLTFMLDGHQFFAANPIIDEGGGTQNRRLGTEIDLITTYAITKEIMVEAGYCAMRATDTMASPQVKNVSNADKNAYWAYLMLNIKTDLFKASK